MSSRFGKVFCTIIAILILSPLAHGQNLPGPAPLRCDYKNLNDWLKASSDELRFLSRLKTVRLLPPVAPFWNEYDGIASFKKIRRNNLAFASAEKYLAQSYPWLIPFIEARDQFALDKRLAPFRDVLKFGLVDHTAIEAHVDYTIRIDPGYFEDVHKMAPEVFPAIAAWAVGHEIGHFVETQNLFARHRDVIRQDHFLVDGIGTILSGARPADVYTYLHILDQESRVRAYNTDLASRMKCLKKLLDGEVKSTIVENPD